MIKKTPTGYRVICRWREDGRIRHHSKAGFELKREAEQYERNFMANLHGHTVSSLTFQDLLDDYFESNSDMTEATLWHKERMVVLHFAHLNKKRLSAITNKVILQTVNKIKEKDYYSRSYRNTGIAFFKQLLNYANIYHNQNFNTSIITSVPKTSDDVELEQNVWSNDEFNQFIKEVDHQGYRAFFTLLYKTGLRRGEAMALAVKDLNHDEKSILVTKSLGQHEKVPGALKTAYSKRKVLLDDETYELVKSILPDTPNEFIFGGAKPLTATTIARHFDKAIEKSKVKKIRLHDLRHSHATNLINNGANIVAVSRRLGHSDINITLKVYTHLLEKTSKDLLQYI